MHKKAHKKINQPQILTVKLRNAALTQLSNSGEYIERPFVSDSMGIPLAFPLRKKILISLLFVLFLRILLFFPITWRKISGTGII